MIRTLGTVTLLIVLLGCGASESDDETAKGPALSKAGPTACNPIAEGWSCYFPYPSDFYLISDSKLPGKRRVSISPQALPRTINDHVVDIHAFTPADGFSLVPQVVAALPKAINEEPLISEYDDISLSMGPKSPTRLIDAKTGESVLHFARFTAGDNNDEPTLIIQPVVRLTPNRRYLVAITDLKDTEGTPIEVPSGFKHLRDDTPSDNAALNGLRNRYNEHIFPLLEAASLERSQLQLAWDFTTRTEENIMSDALAIRSDAMKVFSQTPPAVEITAVKDNVREHIGRRIKGTFTVPLYMENNEPGARIHRGKNGQPAVNGTVKVPFTMIIPTSVMTANQTAPVRLLQFGHGFFGDRGEVEGGFMAEFANKTRMVTIAVDWWGMSSPDLNHLIGVIGTEPAKAMMFTDRVHQGFVNAMAVGYAAKSTLLEHDAMIINNTPVFDPEHIYFYGLSQGHILGGCFLAMSPHVERAILSSGGAGFSIIMARALPFSTFEIILKAALGRPRGALRFLTQALSTLDRVDASTYAPYVIENTFEGGPSKRHILLQAGLSDSQVPNASAQFHARAMSLVHLQPSPQTVVGLETAEGPVSTSAYVEFDFGLGPLPAGPLSMNEVHEGVRRLEPAIEQGDLFLNPDGTIKNFCTGVCDPD